MQKNVCIPKIYCIGTKINIVMNKELSYVLVHVYTELQLLFYYKIVWKYYYTKLKEVDKSKKISGQILCLYCTIMRIGFLGSVDLKWSYIVELAVLQLCHDEAHDFLWKFAKVKEKEPQISR